MLKAIYCPESDAHENREGGKEKLLALIDTTTDSILVRCGDSRCRRQRRKHGLSSWFRITVNKSGGAKISPVKTGTFELKALPVAVVDELSEYK
jgi:hypothetical protein